MNNFLNTQLICGYFFSPMEAERRGNSAYSLISSVLQPGNICLLQLLLRILQRHDEVIRVPGGDFEHRVHHDGLHDGAQSAGSQLVLDGLVHHIFVDLVIEAEFHVVHLEQLDVLLDDGVFGLNQNSEQCILVQRVQVGQNGEASDDFRN